MKPRIFLLGVLLCTLISQKSHARGTLHALIAGNTKDRNIILREASKNDIKDMTLWLTKTAKSINYRLNLVRFANSEFSNPIHPFTSASILTQIEKLDVKPEDLIVFYCHTHGWRSHIDQNGFPQLNMGMDNEEFLEVTTIRQKLKAKKAKLSIVMVHACNGSDESNTINQVRRVQFNDVNLTRLAPLYIGLRGEIAITSSHTSFVSRSTRQGAISTTFLLNNMVKMAKGEIEQVTWHNLINRSCEEISSHHGSSPFYEINLNNQVRVTPHQENNRKHFAHSEIPRRNTKDFKLTRKKQNKLYVQNNANKPLLILVVYQQSNGELQSSRLTKLHPKKGAFIRNKDLSYISSPNENVWIFTKRIGRKDPRQKIHWEEGTTITVNNEMTNLEYAIIE